MTNLSHLAAPDAAPAQTDTEVEGDAPRPAYPSGPTTSTAASPVQRRAMRPKWYSKPHAPMDELFWRAWNAANSAGVEVQHLLSEYHHARVRQVRQLQQALSALQPRAESEGAIELPGQDLRPV